MNRPSVAICIATYQRPGMLARLLESLTRDVEDTATHTMEIRVVDNDAQGSARSTVQRSLHTAPCPVRYAIEPQQNIALARNRAVGMGGADALIFVDDDEVVAPGWLRAMLTAWQATQADALVGPVRGRLPHEAPAWSRSGGWFDKPVPDHNGPMDWRGGRTSNTLVAGKWFYETGLRFDASFGRSGGSDCRLFAAIAAKGGRFAAASEAVVWEDVEPNRLTFRWLWRRAYRCGLVHHRVSQALGQMQPGRQALRRLIAGLIYGIVGLPSVVVGRPQWLIESGRRLALGLGGLVAWRVPERGQSFVEYTRKNGSHACASLS